MEEELLKARKIEATGVFAGGIVHDYNNLLFTIMGNILMLKKETVKSANASQFLQAAEDAAQKAAKLTRRLLAFTHGESLALERQAAGDLIKDIVHNLDLGENYSIDLQIPEDLPEVSIDTGLISMAMTNIITNAKEATAAGGIITVSAANVRFDENSHQILSALIDTAGEYVRIAVADHGTAIEKEVLPKIFDPYFSTKQRGAEKGLGLGLSTSYSIIRKHNGTILVESEQGVGTTVAIYLPVHTSPPSVTAIG